MSFIASTSSAEKMQDKDKECSRAVDSTVEAECQEAASILAVAECHEVAAASVVADQWEE
jgi:hypothetical protein